MIRFLADITAIVASGAGGILRMVAISLLIMAMGEIMGSIIHEPTLLWRGRPIPIFLWAVLTWIVGGWLLSVSRVFWEDVDR